LDDLEGFILMGGASRRMGKDKAELRLGGQTFVERIVSALSAVTPSIQFVGAKSLTGSAPELVNLPDIYPGWGALGGLHTALAACKSSWAVVVACDLPFVTAELFLHLASLREGFDAVVPVQSDGRPQPLCALYRCETCLSKAAELIASGERRPRALLEAGNTRWVASSELADLGGAANLFANINNPDDYQRALSVAAVMPAEN
jgi:molybdopterin-guanine dinucleotide biosynthesis protein A